MFKRILIPVDFTDKNLAALDLAYQLARWSGGTVTLLHVIERVENIPENELKQFYRHLENNAKTRMNQYAKILTEHDIPVVEKIIYGKRGEQILESAIEDNADLIIVSSHRISVAEGWGTLSYKVALLAPIPVLLVK